ncbi:GDP-mannose-dependent alpha-(1-6)-phosphatidylinositol monomannoside mannosyltransferase [Labrenzia sp. THAF82]|uniref:glycosyltransferase n=1 Tax=Labrenzia sp. THAF82 TaxID=2587861 RepID=UPI0012695328|nr:glycosyltransferase [Labrenzia sp. THAF82]QFT30543.1 GDP-mannose-dependent alpha-(1-6)-phosphatidylinositol monomannoside mannosyltransferase [Labrenzia sp. THAF82]
MHIVFVHRHGPGQFVHLARRLISDGWTATLICESMDRPVPGLRVFRYGDKPGGQGRSGEISGKGSVPYIVAGRRVADILNKLSLNGRKPDLVMGHIGWGGMLFVKDALPDVPAIGYCEYYFQPQGGDLGFAPTEEVSLHHRQTVRLRNTVQLATLDQIDIGISPTAWQKSRFPQEFQSKIVVQHEGIDTSRARPDSVASFRLPNGRLLTAGDPVVTFAARSLEPYRGFPQFVKAAALVATQIPEAQFVIAGGDGVSYGRQTGNASELRDRLVAETGLPQDRAHFLGQVPHQDLVKLFQVSAAHVYLTYPFVLSWSFLEAMACEAPIIASNTAPVQEVIRHKRNGTLVDFWDTNALADEVCAALSDPKSRFDMRRAARRTVVDRFELSGCTLRLQSMLQKVSSLRARMSAPAKNSKQMRQPILERGHA